MARIIPAGALPESHAEKTVLDSLRDNLDESCIVFHSLDVLAKNREERLVDAEIDFLVLSPRGGMLVIEVKGGGIRFDGGQEKWFQNEKPLRQSPFRQAKLNKYAIKDYLKKTIGRLPDITMGHAVCFPDVFTEISDLPPEADSSIMITGREIPYIHEAIESILARYREGDGRQTGKKGIEQVRGALMPVFEYGASLVDRIGSAKRKIFSLTQEQCGLLDFLGDRRRVLIKGCVGSGKTILAVKKAREFASSGKKVLLLCYNQPLSRFLARSVADLGKNITARTYHSFCKSMLEEAGLDVEVRGGRDFWETEIPDRFSRLLDESPLEFDAIIVDEGQDFKVSYWVTLEDMLKKDGYFYIFYDPDQNLYGTEMQFPITDEPYVLTTNCRNTVNICNEVMKHTEEKMRQKPGAPEGEPVVEIRCATDRERRKELGKILHRLVNLEKMAEERIVVLGGHTINHTCLGDNHRIGNFQIEREPETARGTIPYYSYMRFKGCEADVAILLDVDAKDKRWSNPTALYTALSRAKFKVYVLKKD